MILMILKSLLFQYDGEVNSDIYIFFRKDVIRINERYVAQFQLTKVITNKFPLHVTSQILILVSCT